MFHHLEVVFHDTLPSANVRQLFIFGGGSWERGTCEKALWVAEEGNTKKFSCDFKKLNGFE